MFRTLVWDKYGITSEQEVEAKLNDIFSDIDLPTLQADKVRAPCSAATVITKIALLCRPTQIDISRMKIAAVCVA